MQVRNAWSEDAVQAPEASHNAGRSDNNNNNSSVIRSLFEHAPKVLYRPQLRSVRGFISRVTMGTSASVRRSVVARAQWAVARSGQKMYPPVGHSEARKDRRTC